MTVEQEPEFQDQGALDQPEQQVPVTEDREWTPDAPFDRVQDVPAGPSEGGPLNPVLDGTKDVQADVHASGGEQHGGEPAGTGVSPA